MSVRSIIIALPKFPDGFTVIEGTGQWKGRSGVVAGEYKRRFRQEAVLRERSPACARFE